MYHAYYPMKPSVVSLLLATALAVAAEPAKEATPPPAPAEPKPFYDPNAPAPTVDPTKPAPEPTVANPEKAKPGAPDRAKKKAKK